MPAHDNPTREAPQQDRPRRGFGRRRRSKALLALKAIAALLLLALSFGAGFGAGRAYESGGEVRLDTSVIESQIADCSELSTAELTYNGFVRYENGKIPFLSRKAFSMTYKAQVRAGVDLSKAKISVSEQARKIDVSLPGAEIQSNSIDPKSISFYDRSFALLNWDTKQDAVKALEAAKEDAAAKVDKTSLLGTAEDNARTAVEGLLLPFAESGYEVSVKVEESAAQ